MVELTTTKLTTRDGLQLNRLRWASAANSDRAIVFVHGYLEHAGRYDEIARALISRGYTCHAADQRGHGRSGGSRGYVNNFSEYIADLAALVTAVRAESTPRQLFVVGHSMGGVVALAYAIGRRDLAGVAVSSPYLRNAVLVSGARLVALRVLSRVAPRLHLATGIDVSEISRDPEIVRAYATDPLVFRAYTPRWARTMLAAQTATLARAPVLSLPLLMMVTGADRIADPSGAREFYERAGSRDKKLVWYDEHRHENFNELDRTRVYAELADWLDAH